MGKFERVSDPVHSTKILPMERAKSAPPIDRRHEKFQFGGNPMEMTAFEKSVAHGEVEERRKHQTDYIKGIQGRDGGKCEYEQYESFNPEMF